MQQGAKLCRVGVQQAREGCRDGQAVDVAGDNGDGGSCSLDPGFGAGDGGIGALNSRAGGFALRLCADQTGLGCESALVQLACCIHIDVSFADAGLCFGERGLRLWHAALRF